MMIHNQMKKIILLFCLNLILTGCEKSSVEVQKSQEVERRQENKQNLNDLQSSEIWERLNRRIYHCQQPCSRKDLTEISFSQASSYYLLITQDQTGFIEALNSTQDGIQMSILWDDGSGKSKNEDLEIISLDKQQLKMRDQYSHINTYQFVKFDDD